MRGNGIPFEGDAGNRKGLLHKNKTPHQGTVTIAAKKDLLLLLRKDTNAVVFKENHGSFRSCRVPDMNLADCPSLLVTRRFCIPAQPVGPEILNDFCKGLEVKRFYHVAVRMVIKRFDDIALCIGTGKDNYGYAEE